MSSLRWPARLSVPLLVAAALFASGAVAAADPADDAYIAQLRALGFNFSPDRDQAIVAVAHLICYDRSWGLTPDAIANDVHQTLAPRGVALGDVRAMVDLAELTYCPN